MISVIRFEEVEKDIEVKNSISIPNVEKENIINEVVNKIIEEYQNNDCEIYSILDSLSINNLSVNDVVTVYARVYNKIEGDGVIRNYYEGGYIDLVTGEEYMPDRGRF